MVPINTNSILIPKPRRDAEIGKRGERKGDIAAALERRGDVQHTFVVCAPHDIFALRVAFALLVAFAACTARKGQRKQQPADELAADIAADGVASGGQRAVYPDGLVGVGKGDGAGFEELGVYRLRALHQPPVPCKGDGLAAAGEHGDQKAQCAAALAAVDGNLRRGDVPARAGYAYAVFTFGRKFCAQQRQRAAGGGNILGAGEIRDMAFPFGKCRADERPVRHAFGGRRAQGAGNVAGCDGHAHQGTFFPLCKLFSKKSI